MNSVEFTSIINAIANTISTALDDGELSLLSTALVQLGDTLATISVCRSIKENENSL